MHKTLYSLSFLSLLAFVVLIVVHHLSSQEFVKDFSNNPNLKVAMSENVREKVWISQWVMLGLFVLSLFAGLAVATRHTRRPARMQRYPGYRNLNTRFRL